MGAGGKSSGVLGLEVEGWSQTTEGGGRGRGSPVILYRCDVGDADRFREDCLRCKDILEALSPFPSSVCPGTATAGSGLPTEAGAAGAGGRAGIVKGLGSANE